MKKILERDIEKRLCQTVKKLGGEVRKVKWIGRNSAPDRLVGLPGGFFMVELKRPGEKPNKNQIKEIDWLESVGVPVCVIDSFGSIERLLDMWKKR